jgi:sirohydrochlorin cobaltochelatase
MTSLSSSAPKVFAVLIGLVVWLSLGNPALGGERPAIVLTAFGTSTAAADTYAHIEALVRQRFPGHDLRWAFTSKKIREKIRREQGRELKDLTQTLQDLKAAGITRVAVQSLHVVPGEEWEEMLRESRQVPGLNVACGQPLLSSEADRSRVLAALAKTFPRDLQQQAVVLVGHGSPHPQGEAVYLAFEGLVRSWFPGQQVFLGVVEGRPAGEAALEAVKKSPAVAVHFVPLLVVAGDHMMNDILGAEADSWKSRLLAHRPYRIASSRGLGFVDEVVAVFMDHLAEALKHVSS